MIFPDNPEEMTHFVRCIEVKSNLAARCRYFVRCAEVTSNLTTPLLKCLARFAVSGRASPVAGRAAPLRGGAAQPTD